MACWFAAANFAIAHACSSMSLCRALIAGLLMGGLFEVELDEVGTVWFACPCFSSGEAICAMLGSPLGAAEPAEASSWLLPLMGMLPALGLSGRGVFSARWVRPGIVPGLESPRSVPCSENSEPS